MRKSFGCAIVIGWIAAGPTGSAAAGLAGRLVGQACATTADGRAPLTNSTRGKPRLVCEARPTLVDAPAMSGNRR